LSLERQGKNQQQYEREYRGAHPTSFSEIPTKIMSFTGGVSKAGAVRDNGDLRESREAD
jgi:hypothetical protein